MSVCLSVWVCMCVTGAEDLSPQLGGLDEAQRSDNQRAHENNQLPPDQTTDSRESDEAPEDEEDPSDGDWDGSDSGVCLYCVCVRACARARVCVCV